MSHRTDALWQALIADDAFVDALLADADFWRQFASVSPDEQASLMQRRYRAAVPHDSREIQLIRAEQLGLLAALVHKQGLARTRAQWITERTKRVH
jgi:hypothetical protein